jgi:probable HAF family extracellular repeat protein
MTDLGTIYPDVNSYAFGENNRGDVVGGSGPEGFARAYIWHGGVMTDLNTRIAEGSAPDYLFFANDINDRGEIAFYAFNTVDHDFHAAVAIPCDELKGRRGRNNVRIVLPTSVRALLQPTNSHRFGVLPIR